MNDEINIIVSIVLIVIGYTLWYFSVLVRRKYKSDFRSYFLFIIGLIIYCFGFYSLVQPIKLSQFETLIGIFFLFSNMFVYLYFFNSLIKQSKKNRIKLNKRLEGIEQGRLANEKLFGANTAK